MPIKTRKRLSRSTRCRVLMKMLWTYLFSDVCRDTRLRLFRSRRRGATPIENRGTSGAELQRAADKTGDDAVVVGNILLTQAHDIRRACGLNVLGLGE